jgi:Mg2+-importing ATPase
MVMAGIVIPFTSLGKILGFTPLPLAFFLLLTGATSTYLLLVEIILLVEIVKRKLMRRLLE